MMAMLYRVVEAARARGLPDDCFHPDSVISVGGSRKAAVLPADFAEQYEVFFNLTERNFNDGYGMGEMSGFCPKVPYGVGWAMPPWIVPHVIEKSGELLLNPLDTKGTMDAYVRGALDEAP